jgi:hypothetical protein
MAYLHGSSSRVVIIRKRIALLPDVKTISQMAAVGTEETINWAAGMAAYWGKAAVSLDSQIVSR